MGGLREVKSDGQVTKKNVAEKISAYFASPNHAGRIGGLGRVFDHGKPIFQSAIQRSSVVRSAAWALPTYALSDFSGRTARRCCANSDTPFAWKIVAA